MTTDVRDLIIVGSGPAGYTAAVYAARAQLAPLVFEGTQFGGALMTTTEVENYPGFTDGIMGPALMEQMRGQAVRFGAELRSEDVEEVVARRARSRRSSPTASPTRARAVILAMGAAARYLGVPGEQKLLGRGVSACATCDGFFFRDQDIAVIGGGDSAMEEATFLTRFARLGDDRAPPRRVPRLPDHAGARAKDPKIRWRDQRRGHRGARRGQRQGCAPARHPTGEESTLDVTGMFVAIGHDPRSALVRDQVDVDDAGYVLRRRPAPRTRTSPACSPAATSSTTPTGRPSRRPAPAAPRPSTPSAGSPRAPCPAELAGGGYGQASDQVAAVTG